MMSENLARFLRNLSLDPSLLEAFETDPDRILADTDLSDDDKSFLRNADQESWKRDLRTAPEPAPGHIIEGLPR
jgi:hypothetical protein